MSLRPPISTRDYASDLYERAEELRQAMEEDIGPIVWGIFDEQLEEIERKIAALGDDQPVSEEDLLDFAFWFFATYGLLSAWQRRWIVIAYEFGNEATGGTLPPLGTLPPGALPPDAVPLPGPAPGGDGQPGVPVPGVPVPTVPAPGVPGGDGATPDVQDPGSTGDARADAYIESLRSKNDWITENTRREMRDYLESVGIQFGAQLKAQSAAMIMHFRQYFERRGTTIAEMNANAVLLRGFWLAMVDAGVKEKMWVSQRDNIVRRTHREADGQTVPIKASFQVGAASLMHPVDPNGPPEEIMRCRCFMVPVTVTPFPAGPIG